MFTGLIESTATVVLLEQGRASVRIGIKPQIASFDTKLGDSVAINGVCLTIEEYRGAMPVFRAIKETVTRTTLGTLHLGDTVNIERAMPAHGRLDGHIVQGHVDTVGTLKRIEPAGDSNYFHFTVETNFMKYIAEKGSIAVDGISLTVALVSDDGFSVALIPHTIEHTSLKNKRVGHQVNLECDVLARYIEQLLRYGDQSKVEEKSSPNLLDLLERNNF